MKDVIGVIGLALSGLYVGLREYLTQRPESYAPGFSVLRGDRR